MLKICGSGFLCEVVKICGDYFFIIRFIDSLEPDGLFTVSVYKTELEVDQINAIESMKQSNELYKRNSPETFTHYYATPRLIGLSIVLLFVETFLIMCAYNFIKNKSKTRGENTGDGSVSCSENEE